MRSVIQHYTGNACVEIGIGYGSNLLELREKFDLAIGTDLMITDGFGRLRGSNVELFLADSLNCFRRGIFDLVVINPPYLPSEEIVDRAVDGGNGGFEVASHFLDEADRVLAYEGRILILLSSETSFSDFATYCRKKELSFEPIRSKSLFFEQLTVYEIKKNHCIC
jgi:release factor glutamine methyltransferase